VLNIAGHVLGKTLCAASTSAENLRRWAMTDFTGFLKKKKKKTGSDFEIPPEFPRWEHMQDYLTPMTSNAEVFSDLPQPQDSFLDNEILVSFLVDKF
jgi:hypothetical protein